MATHEGMLLGSCYFWCRDDEVWWIEDQLDSLWAEDLFKRCKYPKIETCGDYMVYRFDIWKPNKADLMEKADERIEVLEKLGFRYFPKKKSGKED